MLRLRAQGKAAFFILLEFIPDDFEIAFETKTGTLEEFEAWLASGAPGWLLLDSVDEAPFSRNAEFAEDFQAVSTKRVIPSSIDEPFHRAGGWFHHPRVSLIRPEM